MKITYTTSKSTYLYIKCYKTVIKINPKFITIGGKNMVRRRSNYGQYTDYYPGDKNFKSKYFEDTVEYITCPNCKRRTRYGYSCSHCGYTL